MSKEVDAAQAATLREWADLWGRDGRSGATEVAFLLKRAAHAIELIADDQPLDFETKAVEPSVEDPKQG